MLFQSITIGFQAHHIEKIRLERGIVIINGNVLEIKELIEKGKEGVNEEGEVDSEE